jgi:hypothetical protein
MRNFKLPALRFLILLLSLIMETNQSSAQKYLFYLHGAIMEGQSGNAKSPSFGEYQYDAIIDTFKSAHFIVKSEIRKSNTEVASYAKEIAKQIDELLKKGVKANDITVVGASKGAVIAMYVSTFVKQRDMNFVFLAACNDGNFQSNPDISFIGNILSIYEESDNIGESCIKFKDKASGTINHYKEIEINTGLQHGFLFKPIPDWIKPTIAWANGNYR